MIDPRRYDDLERLAMLLIGDWGTIRTFRPDFFQVHGFPVRIGDLGEIGYLLSAMNDVRDAEGVLREMRGLRAADLAALCIAARRFAGFHAAHIGGDRVRVPFTSLLYYYSLFRKLRNFPRRQAVLDIGAGLGYLPFFLDADCGIETYNQVEVTQSLYLLQSSINACVFGERQRNLATGDSLLPAPLSPETVPRATRVTGSIEIDFPITPACTLFPWWRFDDAFRRTYDVIMSNENICEMDVEALAYIADRAVRSLNPEGFFFIHGIGKTTGARADLIRERMDVLSAAGFRAVLFEPTFGENGKLARPNFILVAPGHPLHANAKRTLRAAEFDLDDPVFGAIYGAGDPDGDITDVATLKAEVTRYLERSLRGNG